MADPDFSVRGECANIAKIKTLIEKENVFIHYTVGKNKEYIIDEFSTALSKKLKLTNLLKQ